MTRRFDVDVARDRQFLGVVSLDEYVARQRAMMAVFVRQQPE